MGGHFHAFLVGLERRLWVTDIPPRWAVWWEGQAQGEANGRGRRRCPKNLQPLACWAARQELRLRQLLAKYKSRHSNPALCGKESSKNAAGGGSQKHLGTVSLGLRLGGLYNRGGASSPAAGKRHRARADDGVAPGRCSTTFNLHENAQPFSDILAAVLATWTVKGARNSDEFVKICQAMQKQVSVFGSKHGWSRMGAESPPHVLLVHHVLGVDRSDWTSFNIADCEGVFPDVRGFLSQAPKHWSMKYLVRMAPEVPSSMHTCSACLAGYATNYKYSGNSKAVRSGGADAIRIVFEDSSEFGGTPRRRAAHAVDNMSGVVQL